MPTVGTTYDSGQQIPMRRFGQPSDKLTFDIIPFAFDSSYPTGGETLDLRPKYTTVVGVAFMNVPLSYHLWYDKTNRKIIAYFEDQTSGVFAEVANTTNLATALADVVVIACGVAYQVSE